MNNEGANRYSTQAVATGCCEPRLVGWPRIKPTKRELRATTELALSVPPRLRNPSAASRRSATSRRSSSLRHQPDKGRRPGRGLVPGSAYLRDLGIAEGTSTPRDDKTDVRDSTGEGCHAAVDPKRSGTYARRRTGRAEGGPGFDSRRLHLPTT